MSLLLRDRLSIAVAPDKVVGVRIGRGFKPRLVDKRIALARQSNANEPPWAPALAALGELMSDMGNMAANVTLIVSNRFLRYALVPWSDKLSNRKEELSFARHVFAGIYGEDIHGWELRLSRTGRRQPQVASAIDRVLLESIRILFEDKPLRLRSVQPYLMAVHNLCRPIQNGNDYLLLTIEKCFYTCAAFCSGSWQSVHSGVLAGSLEDELPGILDRECLWSGIEDRPGVLVYAPELPHFTPDPDAKWPVKALQLQSRYGFSPYADAEYAMAMSTN